MNNKSVVKLISVVLVALLITMSLSLTAVISPAEADSGVKIGQATSDERGKTRNGKAGDQTGGELSISSWCYSSKNGAYNNWKYVFRAKDPKVASGLANAMIAACNNNHIGYDQSGKDRETLFKEAQKIGWDIANVTVDCETTCASVVSVCLNAVGIPISSYWDSGLVYDDLAKTDLFYIYSDSAHTASSDRLEPGDILLSPKKHTAMVVYSPNAPGTENNDALSTTVNQTVTKSTGVKPKAGKNYKLAKALYVRKGPGTKYKKVKRKNLTADGKKHAKKGKYAKLKKGTEVTCLKVKGNWMKIPSGWVSCKKGNLKQ